MPHHEQAWPFAISANNGTWLSGGTVKHSSQILAGYRSCQSVRVSGRATAG